MDLIGRICLNIEIFLFGDHFLYSYDLCAWSCTDLVRRNCLLITLFELQGLMGLPVPLIERFDLRLILNKTSARNLLHLPSELTAPPNMERRLLDCPVVLLKTQWHKSEIYRTDFYDSFQIHHSHWFLDSCCVPEETRSVFAAQLTKSCTSGLSLFVRNHFKMKRKSL